MILTVHPLVVKNSYSHLYNLLQTVSLLQAKWDKDNSGDVSEEEAYVAEMAILTRQKAVSLALPYPRPRIHHPRQTFPAPLASFHLPVARILYIVSSPIFGVDRELLHSGQKSSVLQTTDYETEVRA